MRLLNLFGWLIVALSGFFVVAALFDLFRPHSGDSEPGVLLGIVVFFGIMGFLGFRVATLKLPAALPSETPERRILLLAKQFQGQLTLAEVVLHCHLEASEAQGLLKEMVLMGLAELHISEAGDEVYTFAGFLPQTKQTAKDPLD